MGGEPHQRPDQLVYGLEIRHAGWFFLETVGGFAGEPGGVVTAVASGVRDEPRWEP